MADRKLPNWLDTYLDYTDNSEPATIFKVWCGVFCVAAALQRKCYTVWDDLVFPNFYIVLIGPSGCRKGTAMRPVRFFLRELGVPLASESLTRPALIKELMESQAEYKDPELGMKAHSSLTIIATEFAAFIGQGERDFISTLTQWWDCEDPWVYKTRMYDEEPVYGIWVNMLGATTPSLLQATFPIQAIGGGLTSRMIFVYADKKSKLVSRPQKTHEEKMMEIPLLRDLEAINMMTGEFAFTNECMELIDQHYISQETNIPESLQEKELEPYLTRRPTHLRKLAMIMAAARSNDQLIEARDFARARVILEETEHHMARAYMQYGRTDLAEMFKPVMGVIAQRKKMTRAELLRIFMRDLTVDELDTILRTLLTMDPPFAKMERDEQNPRIVYVYYIGDEENEDGQSLEPSQIPPG